MMNASMEHRPEVARQSLRDYMRTREQHEGASSTAEPIHLGIEQPVTASRHSLRDYMRTRTTHESNNSPVIAESTENTVSYIEPPKLSDYMRSRNANLENSNSAQEIQALEEAFTLPSIEPKRTTKITSTSLLHNDQEETDVQTEVRRWSNRHPLVSGIGTLAVGFLATGALVSGFQDIAMQESTPKQRAMQEVEHSPTTAAEPAQVITTTTPETPELPEAPFSVEPGQVMAYINLPSIDEQVTVIEMSKEQSQAATINNRGSEQLSPIDQLIPDETPNVDNEQVRQWAEETGAITREHRVRGSSRGNANQWESVAGHTQGDTILPDPNHEGNSVIFGHGSTFNAAFANLGALHNGDPLVMLRADGKVLNYTFIEKEVMDAPNLNDKADIERSLRHMNDYKRGDGKKYVTLYHCGDKNGLPGDDTTRVIYRFLLDE